MKKKLRILLFTVSIIATIVCGKEIIGMNISPVIAPDNKLMKNEARAAEKKDHNNQTSTDTSSKNVSKSNILLVNRKNRLEKDYEPKELTTPNVQFISYVDPNVKKMVKTAANALENLFDAAKKDGINLLAVSGYRTYSYQQMLYNRKVSAAGRTEADKYVAQPGASEHNTGLAMDMVSDEYSALEKGFQNTKAYKWLEDNSYKYGFIIRYQKGKENITGYNYEPWHFRYVGIAEATEISQKNITLEEYLNKVE